MLATLSNIASLAKCNGHRGVTCRTQLSTGSHLLWRGVSKHSTLIWICWCLDVARSVNVHSCPMLTVLYQSILSRPLIFGPAGVSCWACWTGLVYSYQKYLRISEVVLSVSGPLYSSQGHTIPLLLMELMCTMTFYPCLLLVLDQSVSGCLMLHVSMSLRYRGHLWWCPRRQKCHQQRQTDLIDIPPQRAQYLQCFGCKVTKRVRFMMMLVYCRTYTSIQIVHRLSHCQNFCNEGGRCSLQYKQYMCRYVFYGVRQLQRQCS